MRVSLSQTQTHTNVQPKFGGKNKLSLSQPNKESEPLMSWTNFARILMSEGIKSASLSLFHCNGHFSFPHCN